MRKKNKKTKSPKKRADLTSFPSWITLTAGFLLLISLINFSYVINQQSLIGIFGYTIGWILTALFGLGSYILIIYIIWTGWRQIFKKSINHPLLKHITIAAMIISLSLLLSVIEVSFPEINISLDNFFYPAQVSRKMHFHISGAFFYYIYKDLPVLNLYKLLGPSFSFLIFFSIFLTSLLILTKTSLKMLLKTVSDLFRTTKNILFQPIKKTEDNKISRYVKLYIPGFSKTGDNAKKQKDVPLDMLAINPEKNLFERPSISRKVKLEKKSEPFLGLKGKLKRQDTLEPHFLSTTPPKNSKREFALSSQRVYNGDFTEYKLPTTSLLTAPINKDQTILKKDLRRQAEVLEETLSSFGIEAKVGQINCGPTITSFEVHPSIGVKVQKIKALENDIALNLEAKSIRILAPIPGKAAIGIEVPNRDPQEVSFKEMLNAYFQSGRKLHIPILLGKTVSGEYVMEDLTKMPHLIIAGATGSGKSVCINTIVMSILMTAKPDEIRLIMIDPKKVELTPYTKLPHLLAPVINEPAGACMAMSWIVKEMEKRYEILKNVGFRNIAAFNTRKINKEFEDGLENEIPEKLPYIVGIIDELADIMMVSSSDFETYIARIAQMARAVGIHLILATQRPSREIITGLIKANFPTRISFKVSSRINSQIILDEVGAETLLGNGDLLFLPPGLHHLIRAQGSYIRDEDINAVVKSITNQSPPKYVIDSFDKLDNMESLINDIMPGAPKDNLYNQALDIVLNTGQASTTFLQRKLKIGYARAASIVDELESNSIIGPAEGSKPRKVLVKVDANIGDD